MNEVTLDAAAKAKLAVVRGRAEVKGPDGELLGHFEPAGPPVNSFTDEDIRRIRAMPQDGPRYKLADIRAEWEARRK